MSNVRWIDQCEQQQVIRQEPRYSQWSAIHGPSEKRVWIFKFELHPEQNADIASNDFHVQMENLKKLDNLGVFPILSYGEYKEGGHSFFYVAIEQPEGMPFTTVAQRMLDEDEENIPQRVRLWLELVENISDMHQLLCFHGNLTPDEIFVSKPDGPGTFVFQFPTLHVWRLRQVFFLQDEQLSSFLPPSVKKRSYRTQFDDHFALGGMLFTLLFPDHPPMKSENDLWNVQVQCDPDLFAILSALLGTGETPLSVILEMGYQYLEKQINQITWSVGWHEEVSQYYYKESGLSIDEWESIFLNDVEKEAYLFTSFDPVERRNVLHVVGQLNQWNLVVNYHQQACTDLYMYRHVPVTAFERERLKEKARRFTGNWAFSSSREKKAQEYLKLIKQETILGKAKKSQKFRSRETFDQWEEVLRLQLQRMNEDDRRAAVSEWRLIEEGSVLEITLMPANVRPLPFETGTEMMIGDDKTQHSIGTFISQKGNKVYVEAALEVNLDELPKTGDLFENQTREKIQLTRQRHILHQFRSGRRVNKQLAHVLIEPSLAKTHPVPLLETFQALNPDQEAALRSALGTETIFLLQGPPGTGKTTWITELILQIFRHHPMARILLASQSNVAIDHVFLKYQAMIHQYAHTFQTVPLAVRIGNEKMSASVQDWGVEQSLQRWISSLENNSDDRIWGLLDRISDPLRYERLLGIYYDWKSMFQRSDEMKPLFLSQSPILIGATCMGSYPLFAWEQTFDWVIVDEAGRATPPEILVPTILGQRVVYVGDHKQLPPVIDHFLQESVADKQEIESLKVSLFEDLFQKIHPLNKATLQTQYRMHPSIADLVSRLFYPETQLITGRKIEDQTWALPYKPLTWIGSDNHPEAREKSHGTSFYNTAEAAIIQNILLQLDEKLAARQQAKTVAVITGYTAQRNKLREAVQSLSLRAVNVEIDTVDAFQGREADLVMYSLVRNNPEGSFGFVRDLKRMNVTLSRAKHLFVMVGSIEMAKRMPRGHIVRDVYESICTTPDGWVCTWKEVVS